MLVQAHCQLESIHSLKCTTAHVVLRCSYTKWLYFYQLY